MHLITCQAKIYFSCNSYLSLNSFLKYYSSFIQLNLAVFMLQGESVRAYIIIEELKIELTNSVYELYYNNIKLHSEERQNEVHLNQLSRPYFKNDLFHYALSKQNKSKKKQREARFDENKKNCKRQIAEMNEAIIPNKQQQFNAEEAFKIQIQSNNQKDYEDQIKQIFTNMTGQQKKHDNPLQQNPNQKKKSLLFTPKSSLKLSIPVMQTEILPKQQNENKRKQKWQMWRLKQDLCKVIKAEDESKQSTNEKQKNEQQKQEKGKIEQVNDESEGNAQQEKSKTKAKTTGKKKKIKKEANYVKTDLKRKYRDRFVGAVNKNLRMLTRNGRMKRAYAKSKLASELQMEQGEMYNSYVISLSQALFVKLNLDDEDGQEEEKLKYQIPLSYQKQNLEKLIKDLMGFSTFREGQYQTIKNILQKKSTLFISETASGKSLTYLISSVILKGLSIVISPLVSLMLDQISHLPADLPAACISSLLNHEQKDRIINLVKQNKIQLLYITPQSFLTDFMYHVRQFPPINFVCIDEAHSMSELSHSFRAAYLSLQDIILKYFRYRTEKPVVLCLTATANSETSDSLCQKLCIESVIKSKSVINKNLFITISRQQLTSKYEALLKYLQHQQIRKCKGILIYCRTKKIMFDVFNYLRNSSALCFIYHSGLPQKQKVQTIEKFRNGEIRIVIATVALGMGLDFQNLECVIHINMPKSVQNYIQEIGRAGRRQKRAYCHLFLDKYDYFTERNYFLADQLDNNNFNSIINLMKQSEKRKLKTDISIDKIDQSHINSPQANLKRLSIDDRIYEKEHNNIDEQNGIFYEDQEQMNNKSEHKNQQGNNQQLQNVQNMVNNQQFKLLTYFKSQTIVQMSGLKQQAILNILLKISKKLGKKIIKILPMSYETLKISFFKKNQQTVKKQSQFYNRLVQNCKVVKGTVYVPLIAKCNQLKMFPIMLLSQVYGLSNKFTLKIQLMNQVFVWQHQISAKNTYSLLENIDKKKQVIQQFNKVQRTSLTKFNIFYSLCFVHSKKSFNHILQQGSIISRADELPQNSVTKKFDKYFSQQTYQCYKQISKQAQAPHISISQNMENVEDQKAEANYLPITDISQQNQTQIQGSVQLFIKHILSINPDKKFITTMAPYRDGRIMTRVFLGVNDTNSNWKTYGQHSYWMKFVDKDYRKLLQIVRKNITNYVIREGPRFLAIEEQKKQQNIKK